MEVTLEVSKPERFRLVRLLQPANIFFMEVTIEVFHVLRSKLVRLQPSKTLTMPVTLDVSHPDKSNEVTPQASETDPYDESAASFANI